MDPQLEALRRQVGQLRRALALVGAAALALGVVAIMIAKRDPHELAIGRVRIEPEGIRIVGDDSNTGVVIDHLAIKIVADGKGGAALMPNEFVMNDRSGAHEVRMFAWGSMGDGAAGIRLEDNDVNEDKHSTSPRSSIYLLVQRDVAKLTLDSPKGKPIELSSAPPRP